MSDNLLKAIIVISIVSMSTILTIVKGSGGYLWLLAILLLVF